MFRNIVLELRIKDEAIGCFNKERVLCEKEFNYNYGKFEVPTMIHGDGREFHIPDDKINLDRLKNLLVGLSPFYYIKHWITAGYRQEDFERAPAAIVDFSIGFEDYGNFHDKEELESSTEVCEVCGATELKNELILRIEPSLAKKFKKSFMGFSSENGAQILSIPFYVFLLDRGIESRFFRPVYNIKKNLVGYYLHGTQNILPLAAVYIEGVSYDSRKCPCCGRVSMRNEDAGGIDIKIYRLTDDAVNLLQAVNVTYEYWPFERRLLINRDLLFLLKEQWEDVLEYAEPVFACSNQRV